MVHMKMLSEVCVLHGSESSDSSRMEDLFLFSSFYISSLHLDHIIN